MSSPHFRVRANEVRAESRALMQKLRSERFASSRAGLLMRTAEKSAGIVAKEAPVAVEKKAARSDAKGIIVSRSINAASLPQAEPELAANAVVAPVVAAEPVVETPAVVPTAEDIEIAVTVLTKALRKPRAGSKAKKLQLEKLPKLPEIAATVAEDTVFGDAIAQDTVQDTVIENAISVVELPEEPAPQIASVPEDTVIAAPKRKAIKRIKKPVEQTVAFDHGPAVALQQSVANAVLLSPIIALQPQAKPSARALMPVSAVPSLGPGMIWRLNQIGIKTLQDMAEIEADDLRLKLGSVARLVRVENWIAFARAA